ncbi:MAG: AraC family transcriptional regulator [Bacteroidota bacterium]
MKVKLHHKDLAELFVENVYPDRFHCSTNEGIVERVYPAQLLGGLGSYREIYMENIHIGYGDISMPNFFEMYFESDMETVELHFALKGKTRAEERNTKQAFQFDYNQHNIIYINNFKGRSWVKPREGYKVFEINLIPSFFKRFIPDTESRFIPFLSAIDRQQNMAMGPYHYPITLPMHLVIQDILNCPRKGLYKRFFLEAKVTELLLLQLEQIASFQHPQPTKLKKVDLDRMHAVKDYLHDHFQESSTLFELAKRFGTNEYSLKKSFKEVFGTTVFNYWSTIKMDRAKQLLLEESITIGEVADQIGYKNPQHFSTAFKRRFGYPPSRIR